MAPRPEAVYREVDGLLSYLITAEIALYRQSVTRGPNIITWHVPQPVPRFLESRQYNLSGYLAWVEMGQYSALLFDGSLLQITYEYAAGQLLRHRLAYVPCPFAIDPELLQRDPLSDVLDIYASGNPGDMNLNSIIRFDFDPDRSARNHPAAHMSLNSAECRIACSGPLRLGHFVDFVFRHFYPVLWSSHPFFDGMARADWGGRTVTDEEARRMHMHWRG